MILWRVLNDGRQNMTFGCKTNMHHKAKLTTAQVIDMRKQHLAYVVGYETLAKRFGCGVSTARDICTYRTRINDKGRKTAF